MFLSEGDQQCQNPTPICGQNPIHHGMGLFSLFSEYCPESLS